MTPRLRWALLALALVPGWIGASSLALQNADPAPLAALGVLSAVAIIAQLWLERVAPGRDPIILPVVLALTAIGLLSIARTAPNFLQRQVISLVLAFGAMLTVASSRDRLRWLRRFKYTWLLAALALLLASLILGVNPSGAGARLWLSVGSFFLQPSELLRLLMIAFLAAFFAERSWGPEWRAWGAGRWSVAGGRPRAARRAAMRSQAQALAPTAVMGAIALAMLVTQQDLGAASLLLFTYAFMLYLATGRAWLPLGLLAALAAAVSAGYFVSARVAQRVDIWLNPWADPQGASFQVVQSLIAIANGGVFGQGLYQGRPGYVPAVHTDFPYVMVGEELGLLGALAILACFSVIVFRGWRTALGASDRYSLLLAGGISAALAVQVIVIVGGNLSVLPLTGVTLPFVSYGGTSLLVSCVMAGLLIRLSADEAQREVGARPAAPMQPSASNLRAASRAMRATAVMLAALALASGYWGVARSRELVARADNPRLVEAELAIARGPILDRNGTALARSEVEGVIENVPRYRRQYGDPAVAPAIGYYSQRYGAGGLEAFADAMLRGERGALDALLHRAQAGAPITTTLDLTLQQRMARAISATTALTPATGAAVVLDWRTGEVLALASAPSFDPNTLDAEWDDLRASPGAPLVNRATQGLYQPGELLPWLLARMEGDDRSMVGDRPSSFAERLPALELHRPVPFELPNEAVMLPATTTYSETVGQGELRVTPLRVATTLATLAAGQPVTPTLIAVSAPIAPQSSRKSHLGYQQFQGVAQIAGDRFLSWHVTVDDQRVTVLAVEMPRP